MDADAWYAGAVRFVAANSLFDGTAAGLFSPDADMTRAMVMTVLARLDDADTSGTPWYAARAKLGRRKRRLRRQQP